MTEMNDPSFEFVIIEHLRNIAKASSQMGTKVGQSKMNYYTSINCLEDYLSNWISVYPDIEKALKDYYVELEDEKKNGKDLTTSYHQNRKRLRILIDLLSRMNILLESDAAGR